MGTDSPKEEVKPKKTEKNVEKYTKPNNSHNSSNKHIRSSSNNQSTTTENTKCSETNHNTFPYTFQWTEGGEEVLMKGDFLENWNREVELKKNTKTGYHEVTLNIPRILLKFKFVVDKKWICSSNYQTSNDNNNINNYIDFSNYNIIDENNNENETKGKKKKKKCNKDINEYNSLFPKIGEFSIEPKILPSNYANFFDLNFASKQNELINGKKKYIKKDKSKHIIQTNCYKTIMPIPQDKIGHIYFEQKNNKNNDNIKRYDKFSTSQRYNKNILTIIYYYPKNKK